MSVGLLAHQGGWDEFLLVAAPIVVIVAVLWLVKKRVDVQGAALPEVEPVDDARPASDPGRPD